MERKSYQVVEESFIEWNLLYEALHLQDMKSYIL